MKPRFLFAAALFSAAIVPTTAAAQQNVGIGIRTGNLELHPSIAGQVGYDSNYFQRSGDADEPVISAIRFRITPALSLNTVSKRRRAVAVGNAPEPEKIRFSANVSAAYNELVATDSQFSDEVSDQRHIDAKAGLKLDIFPRGKWGVDLFGDYLRSVEPSNNPDTSQAFDRDTVRFGAGVNWRPGGGLFEWRLGYEGQVTFFEDAAFEEFNNVQHYAKTRGRWRFLPRTAIMYDASFGFLSYTNDTIQGDSTPVRARVGLKGLVTYNLALLGMVGWGASFYESRRGEPVQDFDSLIGQAEIKWYLQPRPTLETRSAPVGLSSIAVGYVRDFTNSFLGNYYQRDRVYGSFDYSIAGNVLLSLRGGYSRIGHPQSFFDTTPPQLRQGPFTENRADVAAFAEYQTSDTFGINLTGRYDASLGDNNVPTDPTTGATDNLKYSRFQIYLGARWFM